MMKRVVLYPASAPPRIERRSDGEECLREESSGDWVDGVLADCRNGEEVLVCRPLGNWLVWTSATVHDD